MGLSYSAALNGSSVAACNGFAIWSASLRPLPPRARTSDGFSPSSDTKKLALLRAFLNGASDGIRTHAYRNHNPRS